MILVDERVGSRELLGSIRNLGVDAELAGRIDSDFQFSGNGHDGMLLVGIERKTISDLVNSMRDRRLAGSQIGRMIRTYDVCYLIVEGLWRRSRESGVVEAYSGRGWSPVRGNVKYAELDRFLCSLEELGCVRVWRTTDETETAAAITDRFFWWNKAWHEHKTASTIYAPGPEIKAKRGNKPAMFRTECSLVEKWLAQLPRIDSRATEISTYFASALDLATADVERWTVIKGIGKKTAEGIIDAIHN